MIHLARRNRFHFEGMFHETCVLDAPSHRIGQLSAKMLHFNDDCYKSRMRKSFTYSEEQAQRIAKRFKRLHSIHLIGLPVLEFARKFVLRKGYRDGTCGLLFAMHSAGAMFSACALVWDEQNRIPRSTLEIELENHGGTAKRTDAAED